jgi:integrase
VRGYVVQRGERFYAVIYEGLDPITGREHRRWHPAGTDRTEAEVLARRLATDSGTATRATGPTVGTYLTKQWLPLKQLSLRPSTWHGYCRNIELHVLDRIGRIPLRHLRAEHLERLYADLLVGGHTVNGGPLDAKTVREIHVILRRALDDAARRGLLVSNPAQLAHSPKARRLTSAVSRAWNAQQLQAFLQHTKEHRHHPAIWLAANTGLRRSELLALRWGDLDLDEARLSVNGGLVSVAYKLHETRGKTRTSRRCIDLDRRTIDHLRRWQRARLREDVDATMADAYLFATETGEPVHPQLFSDAFRRLVHSSGLPYIRFHDLRHTHATLLLKAGVPVKVVSERLGHSTPGFTMATYQHVLPGMQADAAALFGKLLRAPRTSTASTRWKSR